MREISVTSFPAFSKILSLISKLFLAWAATPLVRALEQERSPQQAALRPRWKPWAAIARLQRRAVPAFVAAGALSLFCLLPLAHAQITQLDDTTLPPYQGAGHDYIKLLSETVNPANGSVSLTINIPTPQGRGISLPFNIVYNSGSVNALQASPINGNVLWEDGGGVMGQGGWSYTAPMASNASWVTKINDNNTTCSYNSGYVFQDPNGGSHPLNLGLLVQAGPAPDCTDYGYNETTGTDGVVTGSFATETATPAFNVTDVHGTVYSFSGAGSPDGSLGEYPESIADRNGNYISVTSSAAGVFSFTDTLGRTVVSSNGFGPAGHTNTITTPEGSYSVTWTTAPASYTVGSTPLSGSGCNEPPTVNTTRTVISSITLPNGKEYQFLYDSTYGLLKEIVYPTGATVTYTWNLSTTDQDVTVYPEGGSGTGFCYYAYQVPVVTARTVSFTGSGTSLTQAFGPYNTTFGTDTWTGRTNVVATTDPVLGTSKTNYTYSAMPQPSNNIYALVTGPWSAVAVESQVTQYDWNNTTTPLQTDIKGWNNGPAQMVCDVRALNNSSSYSGVFYQYSVLNNQVVDKREYDWGGVTSAACYNEASPPSSAPLRDTTTAYQTISYPAYYGGTVTFAVPTAIEACGGVCNSSTLEAETNIVYDCYTTPCVALGTNTATQHYAAFGTTFTTRGNPTTVTNQCFVGTANCSVGNSSTTYTYDITGNVLTKTDPCGNGTCSDMSGTDHTTTYSYTDSFTTLSGGVNSPYTPSNPTYAYVTTISNALGQTNKFTYDFNNGQLTVSTDPNSETTKYIYNDPFSRPTQVNYPDTGETSYAYNDSVYSPTAHTPNVVTTQALTASTSKVTTTAADGMGHVIYSLLSPDSYGNDEVDTAYYGTGSVYTASNPHRSGSNPTDGTTTYVYDGLGRKTQQTQPDGSVQSWAYSTNNVTFTDEVGNQWEDTTDGLGRLTKVLEPGVTVQTPTIPTTYSYDALNDLLSATQTGVSGDTPRVRTFTYDSLGRLLTATNPESGTVCYGTLSGSTCQNNGYDLDSNLVYKTDARAIAITYSYDVLNRITAKSATGLYYTYLYDNTAYSNAIGRLTHASNEVNAAEFFNYDAMGRLVSEPFCIPSDCTYDVSMAAQYDLAGNLTQFTYPDGEVLQIARDGLDRASTATDSSASPSYQYISFTGYAPPGMLAGSTLGTGETESRTYNNRLQMTNMTYSNSAGAFLNRSYTWTNSSGKDNGNLYGWIGNIIPGSSITYTYDTLNRVASAAEESGAYAQTFSYGSFGNLTQAGSFIFSQPYAANNRISGWSYDAAGDLLADQTTDCDLTYDSLAQLTAVSGCNTASYVYDASNQRARSTVGSDWTDSAYFGGQLMAQKSQAGTWTDYIRVDGKLVARTSADASTYYLPDHLESTVETLTQSGGQANIWYYTPFGQNLDSSGTSEVLTFTGQQTDYESGLFHFGARQYSDKLGRFMTPDWSEDPQPVPYADLRNPQSLNLYAYVSNNPASKVDPDGHDPNPCPYNSEGESSCGADTINPATGINSAWVATVDSQYTFIINVSAFFLPAAPPPPDNGFSLFQLQAAADLKPPGHPKPPVPNNIPSIQNGNSQLISQANAAFNQCVQEGALTAVGKGALQSVFEHDTSTGSMVSNGGNSALDLQEECLSENPLAALSPNYSGVVLPGDIGRVPWWLTPFQ